MSEAKEGVKFGNLSITISCKEACVLTDSDGNVLARIFVRQNGYTHKAPIIIQAPVSVRVAREPAPQIRVSGVAGTRTVEKTEPGVNGR